MTFSLRIFVCIFFVLSFNQAHANTCRLSLDDIDQAENTLSLKVVDSKKITMIASLLLKNKCIRESLVSKNYDFGDIYAVAEDIYLEILESGDTFEAVLYRYLSRL